MFFKKKIEYKQTTEFTADQLQRLFLSVNWESGKYPEKLVRAMLNSSRVISAWDGDKLIGLVRALDDGETVAFLHYLLVDPAYQGYHIGDNLMKQIMSFYENLLYVKIIPSDPKTIPFYEKYGFRQYDNYSAMVRKNFS
ncbi:GNAT family N-acetyltransferase [Pseudobutyrivibrio xylanivorans]|uniref:Acetyltransferase (GNAT) domain-containing protein n=1 Tax=Pseudobutyrivibrio xylanivorans DSM 14809 TaxID=1123012 RepID=A0A1M6GA80_PSEXY|nr:GNAT family N-acetyltransferase [Pseudobutyrivibrio xylanivorans]SHJ06890.1 Acetyltransferase (GNAT) domain-containing protein [Pseudobutyrivibrio xylanivorans DSM 14809]